ncbi:cytochrome b561 and DOMON domain-containing protein [Citrus sinensis]|uniref:Cytochrome b561 and DOMON domain-containing protein n=1 Tax=Citrus sinensis TaxID=2711 RepID=A0ACB8HYJ2_CITSI|nr:cytochrome b561 and DOMON domain-containing protein [Citrus sinensis]
MKPTRWVAWAINPTGKGMVGSQSLVAYRNPNGILKAYTSPVMSYGTNLQEGNLSFKVPKISADFSNNEMIIYATIVLPKNMTTVSHVWQEGPVRGDNHLGMHPLGGDNVKSMGTLDLLSGKVTTTKGGTSGTLHFKQVHGIINAVSWGFLMPVGAITARYMKVFQSADPAWFYAHIICQSSAYLLGIAGAGTGIYLGNKSHGIQHSTHRSIGILLLVLGFIQVFALKLRPKKEHKYRIWWNFYHHSVGYAIIILSIFNIFEGFNILNPLKIWRLVYACTLIALGAIAAILEVVTCVIVIRQRRKVENPETNGLEPSWFWIAGDHGTVHGHLEKGVTDQSWGELEIVEEDAAVTVLRCLRLLKRMQQWPIYLDARTRIENDFRSSQGGGNCGRIDGGRIPIVCFAFLGLVRLSLILPDRELVAGKLGRFRWLLIITTSRR